MAICAKLITFSLHRCDAISYSYSKPKYTKIDW